MSSGCKERDVYFLVHLRFCFGMLWAGSAMISVPKATSGYLL